MSKFKVGDIVRFNGVEAWMQGTGPVVRINGCSVTFEVGGKQLGASDYELDLVTEVCPYEDARSQGFGYLVDEVVTLKDQIQYCDDALVHLREERDTLRAEIERLKAELAEVKFKRVTHIQENVKLVEERDILRARVEEYGQQIRFWQKEHQLTQQERDALKQRVEESEAQVEMLEGGFERLLNKRNAERDRPAEYEAQMWKARYKELEAEIESLRPKPVVEVRYTRIGTKAETAWVTKDHMDVDNLKLTFENGVLTDCEVINATQK